MNPKLRRPLLYAFLSMTVFWNCKPKQEKEDGFEVKYTKTVPQEEKVKEPIPVDLENKGIGPIESLSFPEQIDEDMAANGESKFNALCMRCHMIDERMIGPAMVGLYERRSPEWVMNMILNPDGMLREDPIAKALLKEYQAVMNNQNQSEAEAREIAEYLRTL